MGSRGETVDAMVQALLGCQWGRVVSTADDLLACGEQAEQIVVLHDGPVQVPLKLCARHRDRVLAETTPREVGS